MSDTEFGNYVFSNNLTVFEALSELDVVDLHNDIQANNALIVQTRSELHATTQLLDTTVARVNTIDAVVTEVRSDVNSLSNDLTVLDNWVSDLQTSVFNAQRTANTAVSSATRAQQTADSAASSAADALTEARSARNLAGDAAVVANAASTAVVTAQSTANAAQQTANAAAASASSLNDTVNQLTSLLTETRLLADQIFARENDLITGWGSYQNRNTLFQMRSNRSTNGVMMTNVRFTASVRLANGATLPYTEFWIRSPGEIGQPTYPAARVRTGQWVLYLTGGSGSAQQLFINPFNIRDYRP